MSTDDIEGKTTRITRNGQVTIPKEFREEFGLEEGDEIRWESDEDGIKVRKATQSADRGIVVNEAISAEKREAMAAEMAADIRSNDKPSGSPDPLYRRWCTDSVVPRRPLSVPRR
jgi:AbrB family looped-hinge helix DNA binding protein